ncbi:unnamed protein product [Menidia menidia]|uniref:(Atlantic silverside) hypothetical protein n=1 Tax=Menidia menidia TaxID=238744 RepID=A0A8S4B3Q2_9TELE|nr:unnamed protein product [Menidia menidia]
MDPNPPKRLRTGAGGEEPEAERTPTDVSIIMPVYNAGRWLDECLRAISEQDFAGSMELLVFDDASTDDSKKVVEGWTERMEARGIAVVIGGHSSSQPRGVGYAKNKAVSQSCGQYLCFQDAVSVFPSPVPPKTDVGICVLCSGAPIEPSGRVTERSEEARRAEGCGGYTPTVSRRFSSVLIGQLDDIMMPQRVRLQYDQSVRHQNSLIGCRLRRLPEGSTERYTRWINSLTRDQLVTQVYTSHGPTVVMPTWFCSRKLFLTVGPFDEGGKGVPEDLLFFYQSLRRGAGVLRVNECLLVYRYHEKAATHSVTEETIWKLRVDFLQERVLSEWESFTIWNAGKQGRKLYRSLSQTNRQKATFCDVDENKIQKAFYTYEESKDRPKPRVPILHYKDASGPFIVCVKLVRRKECLCVFCDRPSLRSVIRPNDIMSEGVCPVQDAAHTNTHTREAARKRSQTEARRLISYHAGANNTFCRERRLHTRLGFIGDMTGGVLEENLKSLQLKEGTDYCHFN